MKTVAEQFWDHMRDEVLYLPYCSECEEWFYYPREWCPSCYSTDPSWEEASGDGKILTFTVVHETPISRYKDRTPYGLAVVRLSEGPQMMANIIDSEIGEINIGTQVEVVFENRCEEEANDAVDRKTERTIPQFKITE
jgi:uncharacterized OB-fold protein